MSRPQDARPMLKVRDADSIFLHWFNAFVWLAMLATGFGIVSGDFVRLVPRFWPELLQGLAGGNDTLALVHAIIGVSWVAVFALYTAFFMPRVFRFLREVLVVTPWGAAKDLWSMIASLGHLFGLNLPAPKTGRFNGAQRLLGTMILFGSLAIAFSGLYLFFAPKFVAFSASPLYGAVFRWALVAHIGAVMLVLIGLVAHIYYALVEERDSFSSMTTGEAPVDFIKHHNPGWYDELKAEGRVE